LPVTADAWGGLGFIKVSGKIPSIVGNNYRTVAAANIANVANPLPKTQSPTIIVILSVGGLYIFDTRVLQA
jgi:hypothetical protein